MSRSINYIKGDIFEYVPQKGKRIWLPHVCNNRGVMGAGFARRLKEKYPIVMNDYPERLGETGFIEVASGLIVCNMVAQTLYERAKNLRYSALIQCMKTIAFVSCSGGQTSKNIEIHTVKFGAGLAGGNWSFIEELIEEIWLDAGIDVFIYEL